MFKNQNVQYIPWVGKINTTVGPFVVFHLFLDIYRLQRALLMLAIDRTEQIDITGYSVYLITLNRLGDRAITSRHVGPDSSSPTGTHCAKLEPPMISKKQFYLYFETSTIMRTP